MSFRLKYLVDIFFKMKKVSLLLVALMTINYSELKVISSKNLNLGKFELDSFPILRIFFEIGGDSNKIFDTV